MILTVIGTAWWTSRQMATRENLTQPTQDTSASSITSITTIPSNTPITSARPEIAARQEIAALRREMVAEHALIREEIASQTLEIREYIINHLKDHPRD